MGREKGGEEDEERASLMNEGGNADEKQTNETEEDTSGHFPWENNGKDSEARDENFFYSICLCTCPKITWLQFIVLISLFEIVVFIISCCIYGIKNDALLAPNPHALEIMGWQDCKKIKNDWQLWRWVTPIFLHGHLEHIVGNVLGQLYMGSNIEAGIGFWYMFFLYILTGIGGNLLSGCIHPGAFGVGASTSCFGLVGYYLAYLFTDWYAIGRRDWLQRVFLISFVGILLLLNLNIGPNADTKVDNLGHLGGFITGIWAGLAITEFIDQGARNRGRKPDRYSEEEHNTRSSCCDSFFCRWIGTALLIIWFVVLFTLFYTVVNVNVEQGDIDGDDDG